MTEREDPRRTLEGAGNRTHFVPFKIPVSGHVPGSTAFCVFMDNMQISPESPLLLQWLSPCLLLYCRIHNHPLTPLDPPR